MRKLTRRGFTFVELLVAMTLMGIVSVSIYQLLNNNQRVYREQGLRIDLNQNVRAAVSILPAEIRELDASDPNGSDVVAMTGSAFTYNSMRNTYFLCTAPNTGALQVTLDRQTWFGTQTLDVTSQRFLLYAENDPLLRADDAWLHVNATASANGAACTGGTPSVTVTLSGVTAAQLAGVLSGAPVKGYMVVQVLRYQDASGNYWIGSTTQNKTNLTWSSIEPIVGPITSTGLSFAYYDVNGAVTAVAANVARVHISVTGQTQERVRGSGGSLQYATSTLSSQIALRNNRRF
ncbi:MAG: prepilin-type N-terminal cleavage/methylation domain-containing protein [Gemmatimonadetes bacterium]|nr:prepilin-type N-terminal cleavage/methylation domain-containing protein [Gemmatimonadota bacterium]